MAAVTLSTHRRLVSRLIQTASRRSYSLPSSLPQGFVSRPCAVTTSFPRPARPLLLEALGTRNQGCSVGSLRTFSTLGDPEDRFSILEDTSGSFHPAKVARGRRNVKARGSAAAAGGSRRGREVEPSEEPRKGDGGARKARGVTSRTPPAPREAAEGKRKKKQQAQPPAQVPAEKALVIEAGAGGNGALRGELEQEFEDFSGLVRGLNRQAYVEGDSVVDSPFMDSVVKVYCTHTEPNFSLPWQKRRQSHSTGSGFMISGRRLLTNAHCVDHHTQVKVKRRGDDTKFVARVLAIGVECDIALLAVDDSSFWEGTNPLRFGGLPNLQDAVTVVGYPIGGDTISVTSGVVSRIEVMSYVHGSTELLGVQIDAAVNPGNSGGPTFNEAGECVGIAFQGLSSADAENIGYIIPAPVISHFLEDYNRNGKYTGFPTVGIYWQALENPAMRACLKMKPDQKGVFITRVEPTAPSSKVLKSGDVLLKFDTVPVANDGTVAFRKGERVSYKFLVSQKFSGETSHLEILRDGQVQEVDVELCPPKKLIPVHIEGKPPSYFIAAGLVFTAVVEPFLLSEYGQDYEYETPVDLLQKLLHGLAEQTDQQVVVLSQVLANDCSIGYEVIRNAMVKTVNGMSIRNLRQLSEVVDSCTDEFLRVEVGSAQLVVLETNKLKAATQQVLADHSIPFDRSADLRSAAHDHSVVEESVLKGVQTANGATAQSEAADAMETK